MLSRVASRLPFVRSASKLATINNVAPPLRKFAEHEEKVKEAARKFAQETVKPKVTAMDTALQFDRSVISSLFENGFGGIEIPSQYGGSGAGFFSSILAIEEIAKVDPSLGAFTSIHNTLGNVAFLKWGTEEQRKRFLPRLARETACSLAITEAGAGSDAFSMKTTALMAGEDADHFVLNGEKIFITNAEQAEVFLVFASGKPEDKNRGISCFIVEKSFPGVTVGKNPEKVGFRALSTCSVQFDSVLVPRENLLGEFGKANKYAIEMLNDGRIGIAAALIGLAQGAFDLAVEHAKKRQQFGKSILDFQGIQHQMADVATKLEAARLLTYNAARMKQAADAAGNKSGNSYVGDSAMAKLYASQVAHLAATSAVDWMGGAGCVKMGGTSLSAEKFYRDAKLGSILEGTSNIQLNTIARFIVQDRK